MNYWIEQIVSLFTAEIFKFYKIKTFKYLLFFTFESIKTCLQKSHSFNPRNFSQGLLCENFILYYFRILPLRLQSLLNLTFHNPFHIQKELSMLSNIILGTYKSCKLRTQTQNFT